VTLGLERRSCLVVGGGVTAEGKVTGLLEAGARVTVISPRLSRGLAALAGDGHFRWQPREFMGGDTEGFLLVMVATETARSTGRWRTRRGAAARSSTAPTIRSAATFVLPALLRRGPLTVAVSTGGASPTMARLVRDELDATLSGHYARLTEVVAEVRRALRDPGSVNSTGSAGPARSMTRSNGSSPPAGRNDARRRLQERLGADGAWSWSRASRRSGAHHRARAAGLRRARWSSRHLGARSSRSALPVE